MRQHDARLVPLACGAVIACFAGVQIVDSDQGTLWLAGAVGVTLATAAAVVTAGLRNSGASRSGAGALSLFCVGLSLPLAALLPLSASQGRDATRQWAAQAQRAEATVVITSHPREVGQGFRRTWVCEAKTVESDARTSAKVVPPNVRLTLWGEEGCSSSLWQQRVHIAGRLRLGMRGAAAANFSVSDARDLSDPGGVASLANRLRSDLLSHTSQSDSDGMQLVAGLVIGYDDGQSPRLKEALKDSGLSHLSAVSGANITIVGGGAIVVATVLTRHRWLRAVMAALTICCYVLVVGPDPSVLRASAMGGVALAALVWDKTSLGVHSLSLATCLIAAFEPYVITTVGFGLSACATLGIVVVGPWLKDQWEPILGVALGSAAALTVSATLATAPLLAAVDGQLSLVSVFANLAAGMFVAPVTVAGVVALILAPVSATAAGALLWCASIGGSVIAKIAYVSSAMPAATLVFGPDTVGVLAACAAISVVAAVVLWQASKLRTPGALVLAFQRYRAVTQHLMKRMPLDVLHGSAGPADSSDGGATPRPYALVIAGLMVLTLVGVTVVWRPWGMLTGTAAPSDWYAAACDVGQGSAYLARSGPHRAIAIDVGPDATAFRDCLRQMDVDALDAVIVTHFHADHVAAIPEVLQGTAVGSLWLPAVVEPRSASDEVLAAARAHSVATFTPATGTTTIAGLRVDFNAPGNVQCGRTCSSQEVNDASLVALIHSDVGTALFPGDVELVGGARVAAWLAGLAVPVDVLATPHHGSAEQMPLLFEIAQARVHLVSVGRDNAYGHPAPSTMRLLQGSGGGVWRTDESGTVAVGAALVAELG